MKKNESWNYWRLAASLSFQRVIILRQKCLPEQKRLLCIRRQCITSPMGYLQLYPSYSFSEDYCPYVLHKKPVGSPKHTSYWFQKPCDLSTLNFFQTDDAQDLKYLSWVPKAGVHCWKLFTSLQIFLAPKTLRRHSWLKCLPKECDRLCA